MTLSAPSLLTGSSSATDSATYNTASVTPTTDALVLVFVGSGKAANLSDAPTGVQQNGGSGMGALSLLAEISVPNNNETVSIWGGVGTGAAGTFTITHSVAMDNCAWQIVQWTSDVATPTVEQIDTFQVGTTGNQGATLSPSPDAASCVVGVLGYNAGSAQTPTARAGFTTIGSRLTVTSPTIQLWSEYDNTSPPAQPYWGIPNANGQAHAAIEVRDGILPPSGDPVPTIVIGGVEVDATLYIVQGGVEVAVTIDP